MATAGSPGSDPVVFTTSTDLVVVKTELGGMATKVAGEDLVDQSAPAEMGTSVNAFSSPPALGDQLYVGLAQAAPGCAVRLDVVAMADGVGVNPRRPPLVWEAFCGESWLTCDVSDDGTGGLNRSGSLVVHVPEGHVMSLEAGQVYGWLRARVVEPESGQPSYAESPVIRGMNACTVGGTTPAVNARVIATETVGSSEGVPGQRFLLADGPVLAGLGDPVVEVSSETGWQAWTRVEHFAASGPADHDYVLDAFSGESFWGRCSVCRTEARVSTAAYLRTVLSSGSGTTRWAVALGATSAPARS